MSTEPLCLLHVIQATFHLRDQLKKKLSDNSLMKCTMDAALAKGYNTIKTMWDFYREVS